MVLLGVFNWFRKAIQTFSHSAVKRISFTKAVLVWHRHMIWTRGAYSVLEHLESVCKHFGMRIIRCVIRLRVNSVPWIHFKHASNIMLGRFPMFSSCGAMCSQIQVSNWCKWSRSWKIRSFASIRASFAPEYWRSVLNGMQCNSGCHQDRGQASLQSVLRLFTSAL